MLNKLPYTIEDLRNACNNNKIIWKEHATQRLLQRRILKSEAIQSILKGEIIEEYIDGNPLPVASCLGIYNQENPYMLCVAMTESIFIL